MDQPAPQDEQRACGTPVQHGTAAEGQTMSRALGRFGRNVPNAVRADLQPAAPDDGGFALARLRRRDPARA